MNKDKGKNSCGCRVYNQTMEVTCKTSYEQAGGEVKFKAWKNYVITKYILYSLDCLSNKILEPVQKHTLYFYYLLFPVLV